MHAATTDTALHEDIPRWMVLLLAAACGVIVANLYYAQPLIGPISQATGISPAAAGLIVTLTQIGYGLGLLFIVPMGDLFENRRLVLIGLALTCVALVGAALADSAAQLLACMAAIGLGSVGAQVLVPYAAHFSLPHTRGRAVGNVVSGLLLGILLARPFASLIAGWFGWHAIFAISAVLVAALMAVLARYLPRRHPPAGMHYGALLASMWTLVKVTPILRRRSVYHALLFAAFSMFWTASPLWLASPALGLSQKGIALFALVGVMGVVAAPLAGRLADHGWSRPATGLALVFGSLSFLLPHLGPATREWQLGLLLATALLLDCAVSANLVLSQRAIYALGAEIRGRLNGVFMATFFGGAAVGSALAGWIYVQAGWEGVSWLGFAFPLPALLYYLTELRGAPASAPGH